MLLVTAIFVALLFAAGFYLMMKRNIWDVLLGVFLLSHGTNLLLVMMGGWTEASEPPILADAAEYADPLPQALILTAIVIGFGVSAFFLVLMWRGYEESKSTELGELERGEDEA